MKATLTPTITYTLPLESNNIPMNTLIGHTLSLQYTGRIFCSHCRKQTKKSFMQGFCYPCMIKAPEASECILRPELCRAHKGIGRNPEWEEENHNQPHYVYLAKSSVIKVGVTRDNQIPTRWIDQGASEAVPIAKTPNRYLAGCIEVALKEYVTDRTSWQKMLKNNLTEKKLEDYIPIIQTKIPQPLQTYLIKNTTITHLSYPTKHYPTKIKSINLDKITLFTGKLSGIKGQYLLFEDGHVINIRKFTGYEINLKSH